MDNGHPHDQEKLFMYLFITPGQEKKMLTFLARLCWARRRMIF
jgi:hypothetical protein